MFSSIEILMITRVLLFVETIVEFFLSFVIDEQLEIVNNLKSDMSF